MLGWGSEYHTAETLLFRPLAAVSFSTGLLSFRPFQLLSVSLMIADVLWVDRCPLAPCDPVPGWAMKSGQRGCIRLDSIARHALPLFPGDFFFLVVIAILATVRVYKTDDERRGGLEGRCHGLCSMGTRA